MKKTLIWLLLLFLMVTLIACAGEPSPAPPASQASPPGTAEIAPMGVTPGTPGAANDDIVYPPGGFTYRANVHQQGQPDWQPIQQTKTTLSNLTRTADISYRSTIDTGAGETRNNIFFLKLTGFLAPDPLKATYEPINLPEGFSVERGQEMYGGIGGQDRTASRIVMRIRIAENVAPGEYSFQFNVIVDGTEFGVLPCTMIVPATTSSAPTITVLVTEPAATTKPPATSELDEAQAAGQRAAEEFIRNSSTFRFDGIEGSIKLLKTDPGFTSAFRSWSYTFEFQTRQPGHGDRTGQYLAQVITTHSASILVHLEKGTVIMAVCDNTWDMLGEKDLPVTVRGVVISGGDTTPPGGQLDAPRIFTYKVLRDEGTLVNVSYTAYPPSPAGDFNKARVSVEFYRGVVEIGDKIEARGRLNKETNTVVVAEEGDYIRTFLHKATVLGVVVGIQQDTYELLRDDGTFVNVSYNSEGGAAQSLYYESILIGNYMKAVGAYDKSTNTVVVSAQDDFLKTYDYSPIITQEVWE